MSRRKSGAGLVSNGAQGSRGTDRAGNSGLTSSTAHANGRALKSQIPGSKSHRMAPPFSHKEVIHTFVDWICCSSLQDAKSYIASANEATLHAAIAKFHQRERQDPRFTWKSYRKLIEARLVQLRKQKVAKCS